MSIEKIKSFIVSFFQTQGSDILASIIMLVIGLILVKLVIGLMKKGLKKSKLDPICHKFVLSFSKVTLYVIVLISVVSKLGMDSSTLVTILGATGLAIGLAIQDSLSNLAGGFILLFVKPFKVGDFIEISGVSGTVDHINILQTKLETIDNKAVFIPNGQVSSAKIINYSRELTRRLDIVFCIAYENDFEIAKKIILDVVEKKEQALKDPAPLVRVCEYASSSINITTRVWVNTEDYWSLNFDLLEEVKLSFDKNDIKIPYNKLDVSIKQV